MTKVGETIKLRYMSSVGTEYKINVSMTPIGEVHLEDCDFTAVFYVTPSKNLEIKKNEMKQVDGNNFIALVDSSFIGSGELKMRITIELPDADFDDGKRRVVKVVNTNINIEK